MIRQHGGAFIEELDKKKVLIYIDPESSTPASLFVDANEAKLQEKEIRLDKGRAVRAGLLVDRDGHPIPSERPQQIFTRWYGFALTFPECEVFGQ
jgi:hypothetical protein